MNGKKLPLSGLLLLGVFVLISSTQNWLVVDLVDGVSAQAQLSVTGQQLSPPLAPLALALAALAAALAIAGRVFRVVLGVLGVLLGAGIALLSGGVMGSPLGSAAGKVTELTGIGGANATDSAVISASNLTVWPLLTAVAGVIAGLLGIVVLVFGRKWRIGGRRYETAKATGDQAERAALDHDDADRDRFSDWDAQSDGTDPSDGSDPGDETDPSDADSVNLDIPEQTAR
jgi:uncharacterized membrane protein (TIGR02234 family)